MYLFHNRTTPALSLYISLCLFLQNIFNIINVGLCNYGAAITLFTSSLSASHKLFEHLFDNIMHCPSAFFDITPKGRILDRCSSDINCLDLVMPLNIRMCMSTAFQVKLFSNWMQKDVWLKGKFRFPFVIWVLFSFPVRILILFLVFLIAQQIFRSLQSISSSINRILLSIVWYSFQKCFFFLFLVVYVFRSFGTVWGNSWETQRIVLELEICIVLRLFRLLYVLGYVSIVNVTVTN